MQSLTHGTGRAKGRYSVQVTFTVRVNGNESDLVSTGQNQFSSKTHYAINSMASGIDAVNDGPNPCVTHPGSQLPSSLA